jgi:mitochondrial fission protein ELM1
MPLGPIPGNQQIGRSDSPLNGALPDLVLASGWRTLAYVRAIKKQSPSTFTVFLKNPRINADYLDLVWIPAHDNKSGRNVIVTLAGPHRYSQQALRQEFAQLPQELACLPRPFVSVLLGGESKDYSFTPDDCQRLATGLRQIAATGAGLAITPSRRTSDLLAKTVKSALTDYPTFWWDGTGPNPYGYLLAHGDYFVATADSANMLAEACVTGRPIYVFRPSGGSRKFDRLLKLLEEHGAVRPLPAPFEKHQPWSYETLYASDEIAAAIVAKARER